MNNFNYTIEDKKLLLACSSDKFERIADDLEYELYHLANPVVWCPCYLPIFYYRAPVFLQLACTCVL